MPAEPLKVETVVTRYGTTLDVVHTQSGSQPTALLWHGRGTHERLVLRRLAIELAARGRNVVVSDFRADSADGGRRALLDSYRFVTEELSPSDPPELWGWSYGAACALAFTFAEAPHLAAAVALGGRYVRESPFSEQQVIDMVRPVAHDIHLVHGSRDFINPPGESEAMAAALVAAGIRGLVEFPNTDHAGVILAEYSEDLALGVPLAKAIEGHPMVPVLDRLTGSKQ